MSTLKLLLLILFAAKYLPEIFHFKKLSLFSLVFSIAVFLFSLAVLLVNFKEAEGNNSFMSFFYGNSMVLTAAFLIGASEIPGIFKFMSSINVPPALIFSSSFLIIIIIGSGLLMLPTAHTVPLSYLDAFFTSASAVCVTGLVVVDTSTAFTMLGQIVILCLIQIGGLGIMTFTGFFSYIFTSGSSFRDRLLLKEFFSSQSLNNLFKILFKIMLFTFLTEIAGALIIYLSLDWESREKIFFSVFHAVSAFCNAGFSTLSDGLAAPEVRSVYSVHILIAILIILGGIGFPVLLKLYSYLKHLVKVMIRKLQMKKRPVFSDKANVSGYIVLYMSLILIVAGAVLYYVFESENSLAGADDIQKIIISFFGSVSARTAGFNIIDLSQWGYPTVFLMIFLMWIGASPGSTGGGIKTTTFVIAVRSAWNNIRGRDHLIIGNREVCSSTITKVLSIIILSILVISTGFFSLLLTEPAKDPVHLLFEAVSAFCTAGLSIADTPSLSQAGKSVLIILMFVGRIGPLTLLTGIMFAQYKRYSRYPEIDIIIN
jgi:potassium uptake TrkH family protein